MRIHVIQPASIPDDFIAATLTADEKSHAAHFRFPKDAIHWASCRAALRKILADEIQISSKDVPLMVSEFGKPLLAAPFEHLHFNLSHTSDLALLAITQNGPIGIDLESMARANDLLECETSFCHPDEIQNLSAAHIHRSTQLLKIWTAKEAVLKALGTGLSHPPESIRLDFHAVPITAKSDLPLLGIEHQRIRPLVHSALAGYQAFVASPQTHETSIAFSVFAH